MLRRSPLAWKFRAQKTSWGQDGGLAVKLAGRMLGIRDAFLDTAMNEVKCVVRTRVDWYVVRRAECRPWSA
jgi:hypothetical protein